MSERQSENNWEDTDRKVRGPNIPDDWRRYIMEQALRESYKPRMLLADQILKQMQESRDVRNNLPETESIAKLISRARNHPKSPLDEPWSLGCLAEYDIPPDALPIVMLIYENRLAEEEQHFTIREALWIARLYKVIDDPIVLEPFASGYALRDKIDWILSSPVYTRDLDIGVIRYSNKRLTRADIIECPRIIHPLPTWGQEEEEELRMKLKRKGYTLK